jgi:hypothetical protein
VEVEMGLGDGTRTRDFIGFFAFRAPSKKD